MSFKPTMDLSKLRILKLIMTESQCSDGWVDIADEIKRCLNEEGFDETIMNLAVYIRLMDVAGTAEDREAAMQAELANYTPEKKN